MARESPAEPPEVVDQSESRAMDEGEQLADGRIDLNGLLLVLLCACVVAAAVASSFQKENFGLCWQLFRLLLRPAPLADGAVLAVAADAADSADTDEAAECKCAVCWLLPLPASAVALDARTMLVDDR